MDKKDINNTEIRRNNRLLHVSLFYMMIPLLFQNFALRMTRVADSIVIGHFLGPKELVALDIGLKVENFADISFALLGTGGAIIVGHLLGAGEREKANRIYSFCLFLSEILAVLIALLAFWAEPIAVILTGGIDPQITENVRVYIFYMLIVGPFNAIFLCACRFIRVEGYAKIVSAFYVVANVLNVLFDIFFLQYVVRGIQAAIWGSALGYLIASIILLLYLRSPERMLHWVNPLQTDWKTVFNIVRAGTPECLKRVSDTGIYCIRYSLAAALFGIPGMIFGALYAAIRSILDMFVEGIYTTSSIYISIFNGEKDYYAMRSILRASLKLGLLISAAILLTLEIYPAVVFDLFGISVLQDTLTQLLRIGIPILLVDMFLFFWVTRGVIFYFDDETELSFEKDIWFSEEIYVGQGKKLIDKFASTDKFSEAWEPESDGEISEYSGRATRETIIFTD